MGKRAEHLEWVLGKQPILEEFIRGRETMLNQIAARNFDRPPGLLVGAVTNMELQTKRQLSQLNYEIASKAVERELAQQGIDYDLAYKQAAIAWELEKTRLTDALARELADSAKARDDREQVLAGLAVEVGLRQVALINAQTLLQLEEQGLKNQITAAEGQAVDLEVQLARERLATAQKKLELIPHLKAIVAAQEELVAAESENVAYSEELIQERLKQIPIKEDVIGLQEYLVTARDALTAPLLSVAERKQKLAHARLEYETKATAKVEPSNELVAAMEEANAAMRVYISKKGELVDPYLERATKLADLIEPTTDYAEALLESVPYIKELAEKRLLLIEPSLAKAAALRSMISPMIAKAEKTLAYAKGLAGRIETERAIKMLHLDLEEMKRVGVDADLAVMEKRLAEGDMKKSLVAAEVVLKQLKASNKADEIGMEASHLGEQLTARQTAQEGVVAIEKEAISKQVDSHVQSAQIRMQSKYDSVKSRVDSLAGHEGQIEKTSRLRAREREETAEIAASAKITSALIHQIK